MSDYTITIVGTGVVGTSMGLALKQYDESLHLVGHDKELSNAQAAVKMGAFDKAEWNLINACDQADLIILAIPLSGIRPTLETISKDLKPDAVITDTAPSKKPILSWANELLPDRVHYIGGHPLVHPAGAGYEHASPTLFRERLYCLSPAPTANEQTVQLVVGLVNMLGAEPFFLGAAEHDGLTTATEHLPSLLSVALLQTLSGQNSWREIRKLAGRLFNQVSAGAAGDPESLRDSFLESKVTLNYWLDLYIGQLRHLQKLISAGIDSDDTLLEAIDEAVVARANWLSDYQKGQFGAPEKPSLEIEAPNFLKQMIGFGGFRRRSSNSSKGRE